MIQGRGRGFKRYRTRAENRERPFVVLAVDPSTEGAGTDLADPILPAFRPVCTCRPNAVFVSCSRRPAAFASALLACRPRALHPARGSSVCALVRWTPLCRCPDHEGSQYRGYRPARILFGTQRSSLRCRESGGRPSGAGHARNRSDLTSHHTRSRHRSEARSAIPIKRNNGAVLAGLPLDRNPTAPETPRHLGEGVLASTG